MKTSSYFNGDFPNYITFGPILNDVANVLNDGSYSGFKKEHPVFFQRRCFIRTNHPSPSLTKEGSKKEKSYTNTLDYLYGLQLHGIKPGLDRIALLLSHLDAPHQKFPSVHIAGTNGKGSTAAITASILKKAGYRVGCYTSPHLIHFSERITINGVPISDDEIVRLTEVLKRQTDRLPIPITFFEFTTAMAFCYFAQESVEIAVIEVGLGGQFDATNVLTPQVTAITQIGMDHEEYLGNTLLAIAKEKAGIIKETVPVITGVTQPDVFACFEEIARAKNAPLIRLGDQILISGASPEDFVYQNGDKKMRLSCPLMGRHQMENAAIAIGMIEQLSHFKISERHIIEGVASVQWPGRLQMVQEKPKIILDGAHNPSGIAALVSFLEGGDLNRSGKHWLIVGIMRDKNLKEMLLPLAKWADQMILTAPSIERAAKATALALVLDSSIPHIIKETVAGAILFVLSKAASEDRVVITGSLYTVAEALAYFNETTVSPIR
ncbi:MAG: folylpolyglutamate synthase/dihydrofolate synthase family protein [Nitrospirota bacterium]|mgnify:CR=1 FL=1